MATINAWYFRVCTRGAESRGLQAETLLRAAGIDPRELQNPLWRGSDTAMATLVRHIWLALDDEFMGYTQRPVKPGAFALMAELAHGADSVLQALEKATHFYNIVNAGIYTQLTQLGGKDGPQTCLSVTFAEPARDPDHYFIEFWMIIWHRLACWLAGESLPLRRADFTFTRPDQYLEEFKYLFPCPQQFLQPQCQITMDTDLLRGPIRRSRDELTRMIERAPLDLMTIPTRDHSLIRQVRRHLHACLDNPAGVNGTPTLTSTASALALSPETLRRGLRKEGSSLGRLLEDIRRDQACRLLLDSNRTVDQIAADCGYLESRSFTRAFRQWTGHNPSAYRRQYSR